MKIVLDTNVLMAAFGTRGLCEAVFAVCTESHELILSTHILDELREHLTVKFAVPLSHIDEILSLLRQHSAIVAPVELPVHSCRDADDLPVLGTVVAAGAQFLVTGDKDLLELGSFRGVSIVSPREFYNRLANPE